MSLLSRAGLGRRPTRVATLWVTEGDEPPVPYLVDRYLAAGQPVRRLVLNPTGVGRQLRRLVPLGSDRGSREYPLTIQVISPRLLWILLRAPEDTVVIQELGLIGLYAVLSKAWRRRSIVSLVEGDYWYLGRSGTGWSKTVYRRAVAGFVDVFVANSVSAERYLRAELRVPTSKIVVGWWLAGLPPALSAVPPPEELTCRREGPVFLTVGALIPRKGIDLLIGAVARYRREVGPCTLWVVGEGPEHERLAALAGRLGVGEAVRFHGRTDHASLKGLLGACDVFVFTTLQDLVGRVVVEALTADVPVVLSRLSGAVGTIVQDGVNGVVVDPLDPDGLLEGLVRATDPELLPRLREGVRRMKHSLTPEAGAAVVATATKQARSRLRV